MQTIVEIATRAAKNLGILALEGETLRANHKEDLTQAYNELYAELEIRGLIQWSPTADIPDEYAHSIAILVAEKRAVDYQIPNDRYARLRSEGSGQNDDGKAMINLRVLQATDKLGQTEIESF